MMGQIKEKLLKHSGSYNYYKGNYEKLKNVHEDDEKTIEELTDVVRLQELELKQLKSDEKSEDFEMSAQENYNSDNMPNLGIDLDEKLVTDYDYTFSIVIPAYNSVNYLEQCITSLLNQSVNFEENVQLILVDDGSCDESEELYSKYQGLYPENIFVCSQDHQGQSAARNSGFEYVKGKYVNFLDSDDYLSENALEEVFKFYMTHDDVNVVALPIHYFGRIENEDVLNNKFTLEDDILYYNENSYPQRSLSSTFIKTDLIKDNNIKFDESIICSEETLFINNLLEKDNQLGLVSRAKLYQRKRFDFSSIKDQLVSDKVFYINYVENYCDKLSKFKENTKANVFDYLIIYEIKEIIESYDKNFLDEKETATIKSSLINLLDNVDSKIILSNDYLDDNLKTFLIYLKNREQYDDNTVNSIELTADNTCIDNLVDEKLFVKKLQANNGILRVYGYFSSCFDKDDLDIEFIKESPEGKCEKYYCGDDPSKEFVFEDINYLGVCWKSFKSFYTELPLERNEETNCYFEITYKDVTFRPELSYSQYYSYYENEEIFNTPHLLSLKEDHINISRSYSFSIIIAVYNTGHYLHETIQSLLRQSIGFEDSVQLILVDDGSKDNSLDICYDYQKKYPDNIVVLTQSNSGQAVARNNGLRHAKGKYINFLDSDDYISDNTLEDVKNFFDNNEEEIDMVAMPIKMFGRLDNYHVLHGKFYKQRVIDLKVEPNNPQLSASSAFFKKTLFPKFQFAEDMITSEDSIMINKILLEKQKYGVIDSATYYYRKRFDSSSTIDNSVKQKKFYTEKLKNYIMALQEYSYAKYGEVPLFIQYLIAYDMQWIIKEANLELLTDDEKKEFLDEVKLIASQLEEEVVIDNYFITNDAFRSFFLYLIKGEYEFVVKSDTVLLNADDENIDDLEHHAIWLDIVEIKDGHINMSGFLSSYFPQDSIFISAVKEDKNGKVMGEYRAKRSEYTVREDFTYLEKTWQYKYNFDVKVPINEKERCNIKLITNYYEKTPENKLVSCHLSTKFNKYCRLSDKCNFIIKDSHILRYDEDIFELEEYNYDKMKKYEAEVCETIRKEKPYDYKGLLRLRKVYTFLYKYKDKFFKKPIYIFMDRSNKADDNAEHLFKHAVKQRDGIKKFFVVEDNEEYPRLKKIGKTLKYKSFMHKLVYLFADKVISSHPDESVLNPFYDVENDQREYMNSLVTSNTYFIQHGVTLGNVSDWLRKFDKNVSLIVTLSDKEHDSFLEKGYNYDEDIIQTLGFPRFDNLTNNSKKQVLFIPTWRNYLESSEGIFKNSDYFKRINEILNNKELIGNLKEKGYTIVFKPHPRLENKIRDSNKRFIDLFNINDDVIVSHNRSYQELFRDSDLLITDYSSVAFDFAYLKKPLIYFQPDDDYHHGKGYFDFETMGFGEVIRDKSVLFSKINDYLETDCKMEEKYVERVDNFFKFTDKNNCQRVYDWIKEH